MNEQIIEKGGKPEYAILPYDEFIQLIERLEDKEDLDDLRASKTKHIQRWVPEDQSHPFLFEATNHEILFRDE